MNKERLVQIARKVFGESAILPFDELQLLSKAIRNEALEEIAIEFENCFSESGETISEAIRAFKEQQ